MAITIPKVIHEEMIEHAKKCYPQEACGLLSGNGGRAMRFHPVRNMDQSSVSYLMDPKEQMKVFKKMDEAKEELLAIFHSHVASSAEPSQKDRMLAPYPDVSYLIVSLADMEKPDLKSFKIDSGKVAEEKTLIQP